MQDEHWRKPFHPDGASSSAPSNSTSSPSTASSTVVQERITARALAQMAAMIYLANNRKPRWYTHICWACGNKHNPPMRAKRFNRLNALNALTARTLTTL